MEARIIAGSGMHAKRSETDEGRETARHDGEVDEETSIQETEIAAPPGTSRQADERVALGAG
jgi:hypothetical protein